MCDMCYSVIPEEDATLMEGRPTEAEMMKAPTGIMRFQSTPVPAKMNVVDHIFAFLMRSIYCVFKLHVSTYKFLNYIFYAETHSFYLIHLFKYSFKYNLNLNDITYIQYLKP